MACEFKCGRGGGGEDDKKVAEVVVVRMIKS